MWVCMHVQVSACVSMWTHVCARACTCAHRCVCLHTHLCTHVHVSACACMHIQVHTCVCNHGCARSACAVEWIVISVCIDNWIHPNPWERSFASPPWIWIRIQLSMAQKSLFIRISNGWYSIPMGSHLSWPEAMMVEITCGLTINLAGVPFLSCSFREDIPKSHMLFPRESQHLPKAGLLWLLCEKSMGFRVFSKTVA